MNIFIMMVAMILAGSSIAVAKELTGSMPIFLANEMILIFAWIALLPFGVRHIFRWRTETASSLVRLLKWPALQALFGMVLFRVFTFLGLRYLGAIDGGLITATTPCIMAVLAYFVLKECPSPARIKGIVLAVLGVGILNWNSHISIGSLFGCGLILLATACESMLTIFRKMEKVPILSGASTFYIVTFSILFLLPATLIEDKWRLVFYLGIDDFLCCLYMGLVATGLAYICWGYAATRIDANMTGVITALMPLSATVTSVVWLKESLGLTHLFGGICILLSIFLSSISPKA